jgi:hypothetical protein
LTPRTRRFLRERARLHQFDLHAPEAQHTLAAKVIGRRKALGGEWRVLQLDQAVRLRRGETVLVLADGSGWTAARADGCDATVNGERLGDDPHGLPLHGGISFTARRPLTTRRVEAFMATAKGRLVDRHPIHLELWPTQSLSLPLPPHRRSHRVEQLSIHWGSGEYTKPERRLPLGAWGYPYYLDGVLGDVWGVAPKGRSRLAKGKFMEFDEIENIHSFRPRRLREVVVALRSRDGVLTDRPCRIAALEVRYQAPSRTPLLAVELARVVEPRRPISIELPAWAVVDRIDVEWRDEGPAMGRVVLGGQATSFVNVCSGERKVFELSGERVDRVALEAALAPFTVDRLAVFGRRAP